METPEKFKNLAEAVRNEVYGKDVREAIAKSIEETGTSSETAIKITEQLIDGSFDEAELTTEIERRLNELEEEYAPELNNVKSQLAQTTENINERSISVTSPPSPLEGVKGDGTDETETVQNIIDYAHDNNYGVVEFPNIEIMVQADKHRDSDNSTLHSRGVIARSNMEYRFHKNAVLKALPSDHTSYTIFAIDNCENVSVVGGQFIGEKFDHQGDSGEWGHALSVRDSSNVTIKEVFTKDTWGDGLYVRNPIGYKKVLVENSTFTNARRHEVSVIECDGFVFRNNKMYKEDDTKDGIINVGYGGLNIDLEGNSEAHIIRDVLIEGNTFNCPTNTPLRLEKFSSNINVTVRGNVVEKNNNTQGMSLYNCDNLTVENNTLDAEVGGEGLIRITDSKEVTVTNNRMSGGRGLYVSDCENVVIANNPKIINSSHQNVLVRDTENAIFANNTAGVVGGSGSVASQTIVLFSNVVRGKIIGNDLKDSDYRTLYIDDCTQVSVSGNSVNDCLNGIRLIRSDSCTVTNNTIFVPEGFSNNVIELNDTNDSTVTGNTIKGNGHATYGIRFTSEANNNIAVGNIVSGTTGTGIYADSDSQDSVIGENIF